MCQCDRAEAAEVKRCEEAKADQIRLESIMKNSLMDATFYERTFQNWDFSKGDKKMYNFGIQYAEKFREIKTNGIGLLINGEPGNGKTFLSCCIANKLLESYTPVICVSVIGLLSRIKETYSRYGDEAETDIINSLGRADLLILDDLGTENNTDWSRSMIYNIIDSRYRSKLPIIITTNLQVDISRPGNILSDLYGKRTEDRILEMCTPFKHTGKSIRVDEAKKKTKILKELLEG